MVMALTPSNPPEVFISYSHKDEDLFERLEVYLKVLQNQKIITVLHSHRTVPGVDYAKEIEKNLSTARIVLLLVSEDFLASYYCYQVEFERAMERPELQGCVIPVILRPCSYKDTPLGTLQALPKGAKPVVKWDDINDAFLSITEGIKRVVKRITPPTTTTDIQDQQKPNIAIRTLTPLEKIREAIRAFPAVKHTLLLTGIAAISLFILTGLFFQWPRSLDSYFQPRSNASPTSTVSTQEARIVITEVPPYDPVGDRNSQAHIAGKVLGARPENYSIVIYSLTTVWYVQPATIDPKTQIGPDGTWRADIHTGTRYAVLLIPQTYEPPDKTSQSPTRLSGVVASEEIEGKR